MKRSTKISSTLLAVDSHPLGFFEAIRAMVGAERLIEPMQVNPAVSPQVNRAIRTSMQIDMQRRFQSIRKLRQVLVKPTPTTPPARGMQSTLKSTLKASTATLPAQTNWATRILMAMFICAVGILDSYLEFQGGSISLTVIGIAALLIHHWRDAASQKASRYLTDLSFLVTGWSFGLLVGYQISGERSFDSPLEIIAVALLTWLVSAIVGRVVLFFGMVHKVVKW